jgi:non-ribosomal peptide synthetase component F
LGGEKVVPSDLELYKEHFEPGCLLVNGYGLSESTVSLQGFFDMAYENAGSSIPIGTPVEETDILLLNAQETPGRSVGDRPGERLSGRRLLAAIRN